MKALQNFRHKQAKNVFWLFCIFFGFVFIYDDPYAVGGSDSARYAAELIRLHNTNVSLNSLIKTLYNPSTDKLDIYQPLLTWLVSLISGNPHILFAAFAVVFGFFYSRNIWMVFSRINQPIGILLFLLTSYLLLINPIWNINGVRMWTAAHVFLYGVLRYVLGGSKKDVIWVMAAIIFHFSFILPAGVFLAWILLPKKLNGFFALYLFTAFFLEVGLTDASGFLSFLPDIFQPKVKSYTSEGYAEKIQTSREQIASYVQVARKLSNLLVYTLVIFLYSTHGRGKKNRYDTSNLLGFALLLGSFANVASGVPSGGRFISLSTFLFVSVAIIALGQKPSFRPAKVFSYFAMFLLAYAVIFNFRLGLDFIGVSTLIGNPITALFGQGTTPIIDSVKDFLQ